MKTKEEIKEQVRKNNDKIKQKILEATDNGRCWWLYQQLIATPKRYRTSK